MTDPAKIATAMELGVANFSKMAAYVNLDQESLHWSIDLDKDPLGQAKYNEAQAALGETPEGDSVPLQGAYGGER